MPDSRIALQDSQVDAERIAWLALKSSLEMSCLSHFDEYQFFSLDHSQQDIQPQRQPPIKRLQAFPGETRSLLWDTTGTIASQELDHSIDGHGLTTTVYGTLFLVSIGT